MWSIDIRLPAAAALGLLVLVAAPASLSAQESTATRLGLKMSGDEPIQIESDKLEVRESENIAIFSGNVSVTQGPTLLKSGKMTVYYAKDSGSAATGSARRRSRRRASRLARARCRPSCRRWASPSAPGRRRRCGR